MADGKFTEKDIERLNNAFKDTEEGINNVFDKMFDVFDISKKITSQYDKTVKAIRNQYNELDKSKKLVEQYRQNILQIDEEFKNIGNQIEANSAKIHEIAMQEIALSEEKKRKEEELHNINLNILKTMGTLGRVSQDLAKNEDLRVELSNKSKKNEEEKMDLAKQLLSIEETRRTTGENTAHLDEIIVDLKKRQARNTLEGNRITMKTIAAELQQGELLKEQTDLISRLNKQKTHEYIAETKIKQLGEDIKRQAQERLGLETKNFYLDEKQKKLNKDKADLSKAISAEEEHQYQTAKKIVELMMELNLWKLIQFAWERFVQLDAAAEKFRRETGFSNTQMVELRKNAELVNIEFQEFGVGIEQAYASAKALTDIFGRTSLITKETMGNVALLAANLGVAEVDSANVLANFQGLGGATQEAAMNVVKVGAGISEKAGVPFKLVMNDIANASEQTTAMLGANPSKLMKSAIAARALGTDMNKIVSSQRKLLDYSSSINSELEASALLGRSISFQKARQLAYEGNIEGAARATLETVKKAGDFDKMSVYQREKLAEASGMELKDLTKMMAVEKQRDEIMLRGSEADKAKLRAQEAALKKLKEEADLNKQSLIDENEKVLMQQKMQGLMTQMKNIMDAITVSLGSALEPIIRLVVGLLVPSVRIVAGFIKGLISPITKIAEKLVGGAEAGDKFAAMMKKAAPFIDKMVIGAEYLGETVAFLANMWFKVYAIGSMFGSTMIKTGLTVENVVIWFSKMAKSGESFGKGLTGVFKILKPFASIFGKVFGVLMKTFGFVAKFAGPIGLIVNIVQAVVEYAKELIDIWSSDDMSVGDKIIASLIAIPKVIWNVLVQPFIDGIDWILNYFHVNFSLGEFFKELGGQLVSGMTNVAKFMLAPIFDAFQDLWDIITGKYSIGDAILKGIQAVSRLVFFWLAAPFEWAMEKIAGWLGQSPSEIGEGIVNGIKTVGSFVLDALTFPFRTALDFISGIFGGDGTLGTTIVEGIKNIAGFIYDIITSPFKKAVNFVKGLPLIGKLFGGADDISKQVTPEQTQTKTLETSSVVEVKYLDELRDVVSELTEAIANMGNITSETPATGTKMDTSALEARLDTLTNLLVGGAVRVYLDGKDVSAAMSATGR